MTSEKRAFILGMVTAFSECVAGGCKRLALSPPLMPEEYAQIAPEACLLVERHGLIHHHETNPELPEGERWEWLLIAARQSTIDEYLALRARGFSPARSLLLRPVSLPDVNAQRQLINIYERHSFKNSGNGCREEPYRNDASGQET